ncbi:hypothetical protein [Aeromicrobium choanae]|uniref:Integral membrane protein n=1 Tax=Aeromicrobium choanae TaxID=1736691 RepID=A0A1T4YYH9_9ACTN|nr:hypothetical protein [Aeromicrobium choanae]SKB06857.1 hypothetical protein SAMN06295964_1465 [Aeromicrobium choanae]
MRTLATALLWCVATLATFVAIGAQWSATHLLDESGFVELTSRVGDDREVQEAAAALAGEAFADQTGLPIVWHDQVASGVSRAILRLTESPDWSEAWRATTRSTHQRLFAEPTPTDIRADVAPLVDLAIAEVDLPISLPGPGELPVTVSDEDPADLVAAVSRARDLTIVAVGTALIAAVLALAASRRRSTTLAALGIGVLAAAAAWWVLGRVALPQFIEDQSAATAYGRELHEVLTARIVASLDATLVWVALGGAAMTALGLLSRARRS